MGETKRKRGRPTKEDAKAHVIAFRGDNEDKEMLDFICEKEGWTKSFTLKKMLYRQYNLTKFRT